MFIAVSPIVLHKNTLYSAVVAPVGDGNSHVEQQLGVTVGVGVLVFVGVKVLVGVRVLVAVLVGVTDLVGVLVCVTVGVTVFVGVIVGVSVGVGEGVTGIPQSSQSTNGPFNVVAVGISGSGHKFNSSTTVQQLFSSLVIAITPFAE